MSEVAIGCGMAGMRELPPSSAGMVLTDIPSGKTRNPGDRLPDLQEFFGAAWGCLRPNGALVVIVSHLDVAAQLVVMPHYRYDLVWRKTHQTGFFLAKKRPLRNHEHLLVFHRAQPVYHPQMEQGHPPIHAATRRSHSKNYGALTGVTKSRAGATDRYPVSVLDFNSVGTTSPERIHPQQKPAPLLEWLVRTYSDPGDLIVDPFAGSGSTLEAARACGRSAAGWDLTPYTNVTSSI